MRGPSLFKSSPETPPGQLPFRLQLDRVYRWYTLAFLVFVLVMAVLEQMGLPREWIGFIFLFATIGTSPPSAS